MLKRVVETGYTGYFFRVIEEGAVTADANITLLDRVQERFTILRGNQLFFHEQDNRIEIEEIVQLEALAHEWKERFNNVLDRQ